MSAALTYFGGLFLALAAILGLSLFCYKQCRTTPEEGLAFATLSVILTVYVFGLLGNAKIAFLLLCALSALGWALAVFARRITKGGLALEADGQKLSAFFSPAILLYLAVAAFACVSFYGTCYQNWDEFAQWGKALRYMGGTNRLPVDEGFDGYTYMQSATTYFHYFTGCFTRFDEAASYVSNVLLWFAAVPLAFSGSGKEDAPNVFLYGLVTLLGMYAVYEMPLYNLYTEQALAMWTGGILCYRVYAGGDRPIKGYILTGLAVVSISMFKPQAGLLFAGLTLTAVIAMQLRPRKGKALPAAPSKKRALLALAATAGLIALVFLVRKIGGSIAAGNGGIFLNFGRFREYYSEKAFMANLFYTLYRGMFQSLANVEGVTYATGFVFAAALVFLGAKIHAADSPKRTRFLRLGRLFLLGFLFYFAIVYLTYLLILPDADAVSGTSESRYLSMYVLAGLLPLTAPFFRRAETENEHKKLVKGGTALTVAVLLGVSLSANALYYITPALRFDDPYYRMYMQVRANAERVTAITDGAPIYYIYQENDSAAAAAEYAYGKQWSRNTGAYRFTSEEISATGIYGYDISLLPEKLAASGVQYLFVDHTDEYLTAEFKTLFGVSALSDGDLFTVTSEGDAAALTLVENVAANARDVRLVEREH